MKKGALVALAAVSIVAALAAGYWFGSSKTPGSGSAGPAGTAASTAQARKPLYYRNPMGLPDTSPVPKKDPMGMDYVPVFADDAPKSEAGVLAIDAAKVQKLGVRTERAALRALDRVVRASGRIEVDERRVFSVSPKFEGWVERLHVNSTGQPVERGQALFEAYSPELVSAQREYAIALQAARSLKGAGADTQAGMERLAASSLARLRNWDIPPDEIDALVRSSTAHRTLTFRSPASGVVMEKKAIQGARFVPGDTLFQIADLSSVWVVADVFEQDLGLVKTGDIATVRINAYPERTFRGRLTFVYPTLKAETRSVSVRIEIENRERLLKPAMFAQVEIGVPGKPVLAVPTSAVIDSGVRRVVLVQQDAGRFAPREVELGARGDNYVEVRSGVTEGESVVVSANFLIDAESNLKAAISGFGDAQPQAGAHGAHGASAGAAGHRGTGRVDAIDRAANSVSISHGPVDTLKWPAMTMDFKLANPALAAPLQPGSQVAFEFVERAPGEYVVTKIDRAPGNAPAGAAHSGH